MVISAAVNELNVGRVDIPAELLWFNKIEGRIRRPQQLPCRQAVLIVFREMCKRDGTVVRITFSNEHMAVETAHLRDVKYADAAKAVCLDG